MIYTLNVLMVIQAVPELRWSKLIKIKQGIPYFHRVFDEVGEILLYQDKSVTFL